jgi:glycogen operon protein
VDKPGVASLLALTRRLVALRRSAPVLRQRGFFAGRPVPGGDGRKDLAWLRADGTEMTEREWHSPDLRTLGMYLDGDGIRQRGPRGERLSDESYLLVLHAGAEDTAFTLPGLPWASGWEVVVDTVYPDGLAPSGVDRPAAGMDLPVAARSAVLLRAVRSLVGVPHVPPAPPGPIPGTVR